MEGSRCGPPFAPFGFLTLSGSCQREAQTKQKVPARISGAQHWNFPGSAFTQHATLPIISPEIFHSCLRLSSHQVFCPKSQICSVTASLPRVCVICFRMRSFAFTLAWNSITHAGTSCPDGFGGARIILHLLRLDLFDPRLV